MQKVKKKSKIFQPTNSVLVHAARVFCCFDIFLNTNVPMWDTFYLQICKILSKVITINKTQL